jgi:hypothetical protein
VTHRSLWLMALPLLAACDAVSRPTLPTEQEPQIEVRVLAPASDQTVLAGTPFDLVVHGREPSQRLDGLGYVIRLSGSTQRQDSALVSFQPTGDMLLTFQAQLPDTFDRPVHIDVIAVGRAGEQTSSAQPHPLTALHCAGEPFWCP